MDVESVQEIERKYEADGGVELPDPAGVLGSSGPVPADQHDLEAVYFDTPDLRLLAAGVTLRRRTGGPDAGWHLKLPVGPDHREELRLPLGRARRRPPAELAALVRVHSRGTALRPVAELVTSRRSWVRPGADGHPLVELVDDHVTARTLGAETDSVAWREVEIEVCGPDAAALMADADRALRAAGLRRAGSSSKLGKVLAARLPDVPPPPAADKRSTAGEAVLAYLAEQAAAFRAHDPAVRRDRPDAVHQMRVAARRMRSTLQAFGKIVERDATRPLTDELRWAAGELGPARDTEVMAERFDEMLTALPEDLVLGPVHAQLTRTFSRRAAAARTQAVGALDGDRYLDLLAAIDALLADPPLTARAAKPAATELPRAVARAFRRVQRALDAAEGRTGDEHDTALHEARKAAKRLRYATEAAVPVVGKRAVRLQKRLKGVQDVLGTRQDTVVTRETLRELAVAAHGEGGNGFTFGVLHATEAARAADAEAGLAAAWAALRRPKVVGWLAP